VKVSIIIPLYNQAEYVRKAIDSALAQQWDNFEVIVVNDGSTDNWMGVAQVYHDRVVWINQTNRGLATARNAGIRASTGKFILPLDADDWIDPTFLAKTVPLMTDQKIGIVATGMQRHGELNDYVTPRGLTLALELRGNELPYCSLIRRSAYNQVQGGYDSRLWSWEDWSLWISLLKLNWRVGVVDEPLFHYLVKKVSMVTKTHGREGQLQRIMNTIHPGMFLGKRRW
jgi:glycosyltransferase involved in cell wall biosynthesis